ncbi:MAG TPA: hypothetical protein VG722_06560 [Tepidisphaeraceae bacterium]|nr:hypothetical protein [Tepidisphaeraceae bacterium]
MNNILKFVVLIVLLTTAYVTWLGVGGAERGLTPSQRRVAGIISIFGWALTVVLASIA